MFVGKCQGGPMDGMEGQSRYPKGFVVVHPLSRRACVYDFQGHEGAQGAFVARKPSTLDESKAALAAESDTYDVRAYDPEGMGDL